jgi:hypothetical protein
VLVAGGRGWSSVLVASADDVDAGGEHLLLGQKGLYDGTLRA